MSNLTPIVDLLITRRGTGVAIATSTDPYSTFAVHRVDRERWRDAPGESGVYMLYGLVDGEATAYIGMSTADIRARISAHRASDSKSWFTVAFAIPLTSALCPVVEAELIRAARQAEAVRLDNLTTEGQLLDAGDAHVAPAVDAITEALALLLGTDIFSERDEPATEPSPAGGPAPWTMERWMATAEGASGPAYAEGVRELVEAWTSSGKNRTISFGGGKQDAAIFTELREPDTIYWPLALYSSSVEVPIQWLLYRDATSSEHFVRDLFDRFNAIEGVNMPEERRFKRPSFPAAVIADPTARAQVIEVALWFGDEVQQQIDGRAN